MIPDLPGFDTAGALKLLANNQALYAKVLKHFQAQYAGVYAELSKTMLEGDDWATIQREAHTIKGLAGSIGHPELQRTAMALELAIKDKPAVDAGDVRSKAHAFLDVLSTVLCRLGEAFPA